MLWNGSSIPCLQWLWARGELSLCTGRCYRGVSHTSPQLRLFSCRDVERGNGNHKRNDFLSVRWGYLMPVSITENDPRCEMGVPDLGRCCLGSQVSLLPTHGLPGTEASKVFLDLELFWALPRMGAKLWRAPDQAWWCPVPSKACRMAALLMKPKGTSRSAHQEPAHPWISQLSCQVLSPGLLAAAPSPSHPSQSSLGDLKMQISCSLH